MRRLLKYKQKIFFALKFGKGIKGKFTLIIYFLWLSIKQRLGIKSDLTFSISLRIKDRNLNIYLKDYPYEGQEFYNIFINKEYKIELKDQPKRIIDLGGNIGLVSLFFSLKYPNVKIYCFEPNKKIFSRLKKNTKDFSNIYLINKCVVGREGQKVDFYINDKNISSSIKKREESDRKIKVDSITLDNFLDEKDIEIIDLIKFDVEGSEFEVFKNFKKLYRTKYIIGEVHLDLMNTNKKDFLSIFNNFQKEVSNDNSDRFILKAINLNLKD